MWSLSSFHQNSHSHFLSSHNFHFLFCPFILSLIGLWWLGWVPIRLLVVVVVVVGCCGCGGSLTGLWWWVTPWGFVDAVGHLSACGGWIDGSCHGRGGLVCGDWDGFWLGCYSGCRLFQLDGYEYFHDINSYIWWVVCVKVWTRFRFTRLWTT